MLNSEPLPAVFGGDDHIPADPLLETGAFIDPQDDAEPASASASASAAEADATTPASKRNRRTLDEAKAEGRPDWLPEDWIIDYKVRHSGATAGTVDRYYKEPGSGKRFRSKNEVLHFLETGSKLKKKPAADGDNTPSDGVAKKKKKSGAKSKDAAAAATATAGFSFNFGDPPEMVTWSLEDAEEDRWSASIDGEVVAESTQREWAAVFDYLSNHKP